MAIGCTVNMIKTFKWVRCCGSVGGCAGGRIVGNNRAGVSSGIICPLFGYIKMNAFQSTSDTCAISGGANAIITKLNSMNSVKDSISGTSPISFSCQKNALYPVNNYIIRRCKSSLQQQHATHCRNDNSEFDISQDEIADLIKRYGGKRPTSASLQTLMKTAKGDFLKKESNDVIKTSFSSVDEERVLIQIANFLRREIPVRLAHRIQDLSNVPYMSEMDSVKAVKKTYIRSLIQLSSVPRIVTTKQEESFANQLDKLYGLHSNVLIQLAKGAFELRRAVQNGDIQGLGASSSHARSPGNNSPGVEFERMRECHTFLDRFYMSRIGIRVLASQYLALRQQRKQPLPSSEDGDVSANYVGIICKSTSPRDVVHHAAMDATWMCQRRFGEAPEVIISGKIDLTFPYIPTHLHYILLELLKNAMRATMETHFNDDDDDDGASGMTESDDDVPPIHVIIADGQENEDVVIKISDKGGGIPRSHIKRIWSYLFTTADPSIQESLIAIGNNAAGESKLPEDHSIHSPLAGLGYGLPISRSYARYFGGDLSIMSMEGYGTDCFLHLRRLGDSKEPLPV